MKSVVKVNSAAVTESVTVRASWTQYRVGLALLALLAAFSLAAGSLEAGTPPGNQLWFPSFFADAIFIVSPSGEVLDTVSVPGAERPVAIAVDRVGVAWVPFRASDLVARFDSGGSLIDTIPVGDEPVAVAIDRQGAAWIANFAESTVTKITASGRVAFTVPVKPFPRGLTADTQGNVYVTSVGSDTVTKLDPGGNTVFTIVLNANDNPFGVALDRQGYVWISLRGANAVQRRSSDGSLVTEFTLPEGTRPEGVVIGGQNDAWVAGSKDGNIYRLRPGAPVFSFPATPKPVGIAIDGEGFIWVTERVDPVALRFNVDGTLDRMVTIGGRSEFLGDAAGFAQANVLFPNQDFDLDTISNKLEIDIRSNPFDAADDPTMDDSFLEPLIGLACRVENTSVEIAWTNPDPNEYDSIEISRDGTLVSTLSASDTRFLDVDVSPSTHSYDAIGVRDDRGTRIASPTVSCSIAVGQGQVKKANVIQVGDLAVNIFGITKNAGAERGEPRFYVTDPGNGKIYGVDRDFVVLVIIESPFAGIAPTTGIAFDSDGNFGLGSLFVAAGDNGDPNQVATVIEIDLEGTPLGDPIVLAMEGVPVPGGLAGLALTTLDSDQRQGRTARLGMAVGPDDCSIFGFRTTSAFGVLGSGLGAGSILPEASATHPNLGYGQNGVDFPDFTEFDENGGIVRVTSRQGDGMFEIVELRIAKGEATVVGNPIPLTAVTDENVFGGLLIDEDDIAVVGVTTNQVYELGSALFTRGDVDADGAIDVFDALEILNRFVGVFPLAGCIDELDVNDSGEIGITDAIDLLTYIFLLGPAPPAPFPFLGSDPTPDRLPCLQE